MEPRSGAPRSRAMHLVLALVLGLGACTSNDASTPTAAVSPTALAGLRAERPPWRGDPSTWSVTLTWDPPAPPFVADHFEITRDGDTISTTVRGSSFDDTGVLPGHRYEYTVVAVDARGTRTPASATSVKTHGPPLADARLSGRYFTKMRVTSTTLGQSSLKTDWVLKPACAPGPCRAKLAIVGRGSLGTLARAGARYSGTISAPFLILSCQHTHIDETLVVSIRISAARAVGRDWTATAFSGSFTETGAAGGCVTGHNSYSVDGRRV